MCHLTTVLVASRLRHSGPIKIDLFLADDKADIAHLFEVKTDQITTSLYQAVGQAMMHGALQKGEPQRILVLPGEWSTDTASRMKRLGLKVIRYDWKESLPVFENLQKVMS